MMKWKIRNVGLDEEEVGRDKRVIRKLKIVIIKIYIGGIKK